MRKVTEISHISRMKVFRNIGWNDTWENMIPRHHIPGKVLFPQVKVKLTL
jgi:hypothetical protein